MGTPETPVLRRPRWAHPVSPISSALSSGNIARPSLRKRGIKQEKIHSGINWLGSWILWELMKKEKSSGEKNKFLGRLFFMTMADGNQLWYKVKLINHKVENHIRYSPDFLWAPSPCMWKWREHMPSPHWKYSGHEPHVLESLPTSALEL